MNNTQICESLLPSIYDSEEEDDSIIVHHGQGLGKINVGNAGKDQVFSGTLSKLTNDESTAIDEDETMRAESSDESKADEKAYIPVNNKIVNATYSGDKRKWTDRETRLLAIGVKFFPLDYARIQACVGPHRTIDACERKLSRLMQESSFTFEFTLTEEETHLVENVRNMLTSDVDTAGPIDSHKLDEGVENRKVAIHLTSSRAKALSPTEIPRLNANDFSEKELEGKVRDLPICFIQGLMTTMDSKIFTMDELATNYGDAIIDVLQQDADSFGFRIAPHKKSTEVLRDYVRYAQELEKGITMKNEISLDDIHSRVYMKMAIPSSKKTEGLDTIGQFVGVSCTNKSDMNDVVEPNFNKRSMGEIQTGPASHSALENTTNIKDGRTSDKDDEAESNASDDMEQGFVKFAVNIDAGSWVLVTNELEKLPHWCKWGKYDPVLGHLPDSMVIPGMSLPQLYCKVPGVWTGGHEENVRFHSINNNHGPGCSIWGAIAPEFVSKLREVVLLKHSVDIYKNEGSWFPDPEFCRDNKIPMMIGIQKPGDTVILNGATLHWVRSAGFAVNSSWNFGVRDADQMELAIERDAINVKLGIRNIVPLRSLAIQLLINFRNSHTEHDLPLKDPNELAYIHSLIQYLLPQGDVEAEYRVMFEKGVKRGKLKAGKKPKIVEYLLEPKESLVVLCDFCWKEIVHTYVVCDTCAHKNEIKGLAEDFAKALPVFFCPECGLEHGKRKPNHSLEARYKYVENQTDDFCTWIYDYDEYFSEVVCDKSSECSPRKRLKRKIR